MKRKRRNQERKHKYVLFGTIIGTQLTVLTLEVSRHIVIIPGLICFILMGLLLPKAMSR